MRTRSRDMVYKRANMIHCLVHSNALFEAVMRLRPTDPNSRDGREQTDFLPTSSNVVRSRNIRKRPC